MPGNNDGFWFDERRNFTLSDIERFNQEFRAASMDWSPDTDEIEMRLRLYPRVTISGHNGVFTVPDDIIAPIRSVAPPRPPFDDGWIRANHPEGDEYRSRGCRENCEACGDIRAEARRKYDEFYGAPRMPHGQWRELWARFWRNLAVAHTAAVFMDEVRWSGDRFVNEAQILSRLPLPADSASLDGAQGSGPR